MLIRAGRLLLAGQCHLGHLLLQPSHSEPAEWAEKQGGDWGNLVDVSELHMAISGTRSS